MERLRKSVYTLYGDPTRNEWIVKIQLALKKNAKLKLLAKVCKNKPSRREIIEPSSHSDAAKLLLPALNTMFDIATTRTMWLELHPPRIIYALLFGLGLICSLMAGYGMASRRRGWLHIIGFTVLTVVIVYVMLDVEYPRAGLIRLEAGDQMLIKVRESMQ